MPKCLLYSEHYKPIHVRNELGWDSKCNKNQDSNICAFHIGAELHMYYEFGRSYICAVQIGAKLQMHNKLDGATDTVQVTLGWAYRYSASWGGATATCYSIQSMGKYN